MGNKCLGSRNSKGGIFYSLSHAIWWSRSGIVSKGVSKKSIKNPNPNPNSNQTVQNTPPEPVKIVDERPNKPLEWEAKQVEVVKPNEDLIIIKPLEPLVLPMEDLIKPAEQPPKYDEEIRPLVELEIPKSSVELEITKSPVELEIPKSQVELEIPKSPVESEMPPKEDSSGSNSNNVSEELMKAKKPKKIVSAGLQVESVLQTKTGHIREYYSLGRKLGHGQFGTTFLCLEKSTGKEYACKSIAKRKLATMEDVDDVRREIQIMHHLVGIPSIVSIKGAYEDAVSVHVVMELCEGGELFDRIVKLGHYTEKQAAELARTIVGVIEACHSLGVMHRDLKPENFLFVDSREDSPLKAIDFGLSIFFKPGMVKSSTKYIVKLLYNYSVF